MLGFTVTDPATGDKFTYIVKYVEGVGSEKHCFTYSSLQETPTPTAISVPAATSTPIPTNTAIPTAVQDSCADLAPPESGRPVSMKFVNEAGSDVEYFWINDSDGSLVPQSTIRIGKYETQNTTPGHIFQFQIPSGSFKYTVGSALTQCAIITTNGVEKR